MEVLKTKLWNYLLRLLSNILYDHNCITIKLTFLIYRKILICQNFLNVIYINY